VVEGRKSVAEAMSSGAPVESVFVDVEAASPDDLELVGAMRSAGIAVTEVQPGVLTRACDAVTPQPVAATVRAVDVSLAGMADRRPEFVAVLAGVADPRNARSIAAGRGGVVLCEGSVDLYNPKTVRSSAGAIFRVPVTRGVAVESVAGDLEVLGYRVVAASAAGGRPYTDVDLTGPVAVALGNEAHGLPSSLAGAAGATLRIPMAENTESLGVAAAAAVIVFEAARQRSLAARPASGTHGAASAASGPDARVAGAA
jgi:TrmH family RNA methyltransferase